MPAKQAKKRTKAKGPEKGKAAAARQKPKAKREGMKAPAADLAALKKTAQEMKAIFDKAGKDADQLRAKAKEVEAAAKTAYVEALGPYRDACRKAGVECEFEGARAANRTPAVRFLVEKVKDGVKVTIKDRPETEEVIPKKAIEESIGKSAEAYVTKFIGDREVVGNKQGSLGNRLRAVLKTG